MLEKIVSGGQTGADRAVLDTAMALGIAVGGWCPRCRHAEDGVIPDKYPLKETPSELFGQRTQWNVRDSDGTLLFDRDQKSAQVGFTFVAVKSQGKPFFIVALDNPPPVDAVMAWLQAHQIKVLNVAGPRESKQPGTYRQVANYMQPLLQAVLAHSP